MLATDEYVRQRDGVWYVGESGVTVYAVIAMWQQGFAPEEIQASFPHLSLREIYGAILRYFEHQDELDAFFRKQDALYHRLKSESEAQHPAFYADMRERIARLRGNGGSHPPTAS